MARIRFHPTIGNVPAGRADSFVSPHSSLVHTHVHSEPSPTVTHGVTALAGYGPQEVMLGRCPDGLFEVELDSEPVEWREACRGGCRAR